MALAYNLKKSDCERKYNYQVYRESTKKVGTGKACPFADGTRRQTPDYFTYSDRSMDHGIEDEECDD